MGNHEGTHKKNGRTGPEPQTLRSGDEDCCLTAHRDVDVDQTTELSVVEGVHREPILRPRRKVHNQEQHYSLEHHVSTKNEREEEHTWEIPMIRGLRGIYSVLRNGQDCTVIQKGLG